MYPFPCGGGEKDWKGGGDRSVFGSRCCSGSIAESLVYICWIGRPCPSSQLQTYHMLVSVIRYVSTSRARRRPEWSGTKNARDGGKKGSNKTVQFSQGPLQKKRKQFFYCNFHCKRRRNILAGSRQRLPLQKHVALCRPQQLLERKRTVTSQRPTRRLGLEKPSVLLRFKNRACLQVVFRQVVLAFEARVRGLKTNCSQWWWETIWQARHSAGPAERWWGDTVSPQQQQRAVERGGAWSWPKMCHPRNPYFGGRISSSETKRILQEPEIVLRREIKRNPAEGAAHWRPKILHLCFLGGKRGAATLNLACWRLREGAG